MAEEQWRGRIEDRGAGIDNREVKRCLYLMSDCIVNNGQKFKTHYLLEQPRGMGVREEEAKKRKRRRIGINPGLMII